MWLSIVLFVISLIAGCLVSYNFLAEKIPQLDQIKGIAEGSKVYVGITSLVIGIWSLLKYDFYGDLIPALFTIASGMILANVIFDYFNLSQDSEKSELRKSKVQGNLEQYSIPIGFATLLFSIIHLIDIIAGDGISYSSPFI